MSSGFKWDTDQEWDGQQIEANLQGRRKRRRYLWILSAVCLTLIALLYWQWRRVRVQEETIVEDVQATYQVWHRAALERDVELFLHQLSADDEEWRSAQKMLLLQQRVLDHPELGLDYRGDSKGPVDVASMDLAPDWQSGRLTVTLPYRSRNEKRLALEKVYTFLRQDGRWVLTPPGEAFWGREERSEAPGLTVFYPSRDAEIADRMSEDLASELRRLCQEQTADVEACLATLDLTVRFEGDPALQAAFRDDYLPYFRDGGIALPTPSLIGHPQSEDAYDALYRGYTERILRLVRDQISPKVNLPAQDLLSLCLRQKGEEPHLLRFAVEEGEWSSEQSDRAFRFLIPVPGKDGVILQWLSRDEQSREMNTVWWRDGQEQLLFSEELQQPLTRSAGWASSERPRLLLQNVSRSSNIRRRWLDPRRCQATGCQPVELSGFTAWAPGGDHTLVVQGTEIWRGDEQGRPQAVLGTGLSPFWLDDQTYGYVRYDWEAGAPSMQVATSTLGVDLPHIPLHVGELAEVVDPEMPPLLFINHVTPSPVDPDLLLLSATTVGGSEPRYHFFSFRLSSGETRLLLQLGRLPTGDPALLTPTGHPPFRLSPDGRWLTVTYLAQASPASWRFLLYDLQEEQSQELTVHYPSYPSRFPYYDWTPDGRWLAIVDDGFLRLTAPAVGHQRIIRFEHNACLYAAWINDS